MNPGDQPAGDKPVGDNPTVGDQPAGMPVGGPAAPSTPSDTGTGLPPMGGGVPPVTGGLPGEEKKPGEEAPPENPTVPPAA